MTHLSPWQFTSLYFPSHCRGQEAVFIRAQDAEIVSCLCSCQFQLVREQLSPIGQTQIGDTLSPSDWSTPHFLASDWLNIPPSCGRDESPSHEYIITWRQTLCSLQATSGETILTGQGNYFEASSLRDDENTEMKLRGEKIC